MSSFNSYFPLKFNPEEDDEYTFGLSVNETSKYPDLTNHFLNPAKLPSRSEHHSLTLVWDLDQTLVSADGIGDQDPDDDDTKLVIRPYAKKVLNVLRATLPHAEFIIWTAGIESHAKRVCLSLPKGMFNHVISRSDYSYPIKDLKKLEITGRSLDNMFLIDDRNDISAVNPEHVLCVPPYHPKEEYGKDDKTLLYLANIVYRACKKKERHPEKELYKFLYSPLTQKITDSNGKYFFGVKCFKSKKEIMDKIKSFKGKHL